MFHPDQSGILPCLLRSLHHNYGAVGSGEIRDEKIGRVEKSDRWNVGQWRCARGSFSLRFSLLLSLPGPQLKRVKEIGGESASHPHLPLSMQMCRSWGCVIFLEKHYWQTLNAGCDDNRVWQRWHFSAQDRQSLLPVQDMIIHILLIFHWAEHKRSPGVRFGSKELGGFSLWLDEQGLVPLWSLYYAAVINLRCNDKTPSLFNLKK